MNFAVVIVTYNRLPLLRECLEACLAQSLSPQSIIVVDNCSTDGTREYLDSQKPGPVRVFHADENLGGAWGFSKGVELLKDSEYDFALLIDDDAILRPDFLQAIADAVDAYPGYMAYAGAVYVDGRVDVGHRQVVSNKVLGSFTAVPVQDYLKNVFCCDTATFCGLAVRRCAISQLGLPQKDYFIWFDDVDYSLRIGRLSRILNVNSAALDHKTSVSFSLNKVCWKTYYGDRNYINLLKNHFGFWAVSFSVAKKVLKIAKASIFREKVGNFVVARLFFDALVDGLKGRLGRNDNYLP